ncbi:hypothetical protein NIES22_31860 [Calothrix brevissima NIES-22]|nr:hypothetical protein NIES22_31860 [Calothrix brevissima NIES-22]
MEKLILVVYRINYAGLLDPRLLREVGDLTNTKFSQLIRKTTSLNIVIFILQFIIFHARYYPKS